MTYSFKLPVEFIEFLKQEGALDVYLNKVKSEFELISDDNLATIVLKSKLNILEKKTRWSDKYLKKSKNTISYFILILNWNLGTFKEYEFWSDLYYKLIRSGYNKKFI